MVEFTRNQNPLEIVSFGYKDLGFFSKGSKEYSDVIYLSIKNMSELKILEISEDICQMFIKEQMKAKITAK